MATPFTLMRLAVSCTLAAAMLAACGGSQMSGSSVGMTPPGAGAPSSQHSPISPADDCGGGDTHGGFNPNDDGGGCCGGGDTHGGVTPMDGGGCCGGGGDDGGSWVGGIHNGGIHNNDGESGHCKNITVKPDRVFFTVSNPGPVTVKVKTRQTGTVSEQDTCGGSTGVATVAEVGTTNQWTVTAGALTGSCKALFVLKNTSGTKIGEAVLHITNFL